MDQFVTVANFGQAKKSKKRKKMENTEIQKNEEIKKGKAIEIPSQKMENYEKDRPTTGFSFAHNIIENREFFPNNSIFPKNSEENTMEIPNILIDFWMSHLGPAEFKILAFFVRIMSKKKKCTGTISGADIAIFTKLPKRSIYRALNRMCEIGVVKKIQSINETGDYAANKYEVDLYCNKNFNSIEKYIQKDMPENENEVMSVLASERCHYHEKPVQEGVVPPLDIYINNIIPSNNYNINVESVKGGVGENTEATPPSRSLSSSLKKPNERPRIKTVKAPLRVKPSNFAVREVEPTLLRAPHVGTTKAEHEKLVEKYGVEKTQKYYEILSEWKEDTARSKWKKNDYRSILRWVVTAEAEREQKNAKVGIKNNDYLKSDRELAEKIWNKFKNKRPDISLSSKYIEFSYGPASPSVVLEFGTKDFRMKALDQLRKKGINVVEGR